MKGYFKTVISTVLCYLIVLSMFPVTSLTSLAAYTGAGTESNPYVVSTASDLITVLSYYNTEGTYIKLGKDINLNSSYEPGEFNAVLDGNFYTVTGTSRFFTLNNGTLKNFYYTATERITTSGTENGYCVGAVCDENNGLISGVIVTAEVSSASEAGIIAGYNSGKIINCAAFGSASASNAYGSSAGGITTGGEVYNCYTSASVSATGGSRYGYGYAHPISTGSYYNSYYCSQYYNSSTTAIPVDEMKTADFVAKLNNGTEITDSIWVQDTSNKNSGYPVLKRALDCTIASSKTNIVISDTEYITLTGSDNAATIYYTTDGTTPTTSSNRYNGSIEISDDITIKAVAYKSGIYSKVQTFSYCKPDGEGTADFPYLIRTSTDFFSIQELGKGAHYLILNDIVLEKDVTSIDSFYGCIDGLNHTISGVSSDSTTYGFIKKNYGVIKNINFEVAEHTEFVSSAGIIGKNYGVVYNCHFEGNLNSRNITNSSTGEIHSTGGLVSHNYGRLEKCSFKGGVYGKSVCEAGGIVGYNEGEVLYCDFEGEVDIFAVSFSCKQGYVGGFVGYTTATSSIKYCDAKVTKVYSSPKNYSGVYVGGFVGGSAGSVIVDCTAEIGSVSYSHFYTEWGRNETNTSTGVTELGYKPEAHDHNYNIVSYPPICREYLKVDCYCECGVVLNLEWYDSEWSNKSHNFSEGYIIEAEPTCTQDGEATIHCSNCIYYETLTVPATNHLGEMTLIEKSDYPESEHAYLINTDETKTFTYPGADHLRLWFSKSTYTQSNADYIYLYDKDDNLIGQYSDDQLEGKIIDIAGDTFKIRLTSNSYYNYYGYSFEAIYAFDEGDEGFVTTTKPTCTAAGEARKFCKVCDYYDSMSIPATGHVGKATLIDKSLYPESSHDYDINTDETKIFSYPGATYLKIKFSSNTVTENNYDYIYLYDKDDVLIGKYSGIELREKELVIDGDTFKIRLISDSIYNYYGYSFDAIYAYNSGNILIDSSLYPESDHNYANNLNEVKTFSYPGAISLSLTFNDQTAVESECDRIYIFDGNNIEIGVYTGTDLANKTVVVPGDTVKIILTSDVSVVKYGYAISSIYADVGGYGEWEKTTDPTCVLEGEYQRVCGTCNYVDKKAAAALGHSYTSAITTPATHLTEGVKTFTCSACSDSYTEAIEKISEHTYVPAITAPTCTEVGYTTYTCGCGDSYTANEVAALGHSFTHYVSDNNATYTENGTKTAKCDRCDETDTLTDNGTILTPSSIAVTTLPENIYYLLNEGIDLSGLTFTAYYADGGSHEFTAADVDSYKADTQSTGKKTVTVTYMGCQASFVIYVHSGGSVLVDSALYPESDHDYANYLNEIKTFTYDGALSLEVKFNSKTFVENNYDKIYLYNGSGTQIGVYTGSQLSGVTVTIPGDTFKIKLTSDVSVAGFGYKIDSIYAETGSEIIHPEVIDEATVSCTQDGLSQGSHCEICDMVLVEQVQTPALGHDEISHDAQASTCSEKGWKAYVTCSRCDYTTYEELPLAEHSYTSNVTEPTCIANGYTTYTCACGHSYIADNVNALGHDEIEHEEKNQTCTEKGWKAYVTCSRCDYTTYEEIAADGHKFSSKVTAPTCTSKGYTTFTCECGASYVSGYVETIPHSYNSTITTPATHLSEGVRTYTCNGCGYSYTEAISKTAEHTYFVVDVVEPTCDTKGYTIYACECGEKYNGDNIPAKGHNYDGDNCTNCGKSKIENCTCNCHKSGISGIFWKILRFFYKLFGMKKYCGCGVTHY